MFIPTLLLTLSVVAEEPEPLELLKPADKDKLGDIMLHVPAKREGIWSKACQDATQQCVVVTLEGLPVDAPPGTENAESPRVTSLAKCVVDARGMPDRPLTLEARAPREKNALGKLDFSKGDLRDKAVEACASQHLVGWELTGKAATVEFRVLVKREVQVHGLALGGLGPAMKDMHGLSKEDMRPVFKKTGPLFRQCVGEWRGKVVARLTVGKAGNVMDASLDENTAPAPVQECLLKALRGMEFPAATALTKVTYPLRFDERGQ